MAYPRATNNLATGPRELQRLADGRVHALQMLSAPMHRDGLHALRSGDTRVICIELFRPADDVTMPVESPERVEGAEPMYMTDDSEPGKNSNVVAHVPTVACVLGCNSNIEFLGAVTDAKAALYYIIKYIGKESTSLDAMLPLLARVQAHVRDYPSVAEDAGQPSRTAKHMLTRINNQAWSMEEVPAQLAAVALLGMDSMVTSHAFWWCYIYPAIAAAKSIHANLPNLLEPVHADDETDDGLPSNWTHGEGEGEEDEEEDDWLAHVEGEDALNEEEEREPTNADYAGLGSAFKVDKGKVLIVQQHQNYQHRGPPLQNVSIYEYGAFINVTKKDKKAGQQKKQKKKKSAEGHGGALHADEADEAEEDEQEEAEDAGPEEEAGEGIDKEPEEANGNGELPGSAMPAASRGPGRPKDTMFAFTAEHPLYRTHLQQLKSKQCIPRLAGPAPPRHPGPMRPGKAWLDAANHFAAYVICLFHPWSLETLAPPIPLTWNAFQLWVGRLELSQHYVDRARLAWIQNLSLGLVVNSAARLMLADYRARSAMRWNAENKPAGEGRQADPDLEAFVEVLQNGGEVAARSSAAEQRDADTRALVDFLARMPSPAGLAPLPPLLPGSHRIPFEVIRATASALAAPLPEPPELEHPRHGGRDPWMALDCSEDPLLSREQNYLLQAMLRWLRDSPAVPLPQASAQAHPVAAAANTQNQEEAMAVLQKLVLGGPGTGKTFTQERVMLRLEQVHLESAIVYASTTGCAASLLPSGHTLHSLLKLSQMTERGNGASGKSIDNAMRAFQPLKPQPLLEVQARLKNMRLLVIDEISMMSQLLLLQVDGRLRQICNCHQPFGGIGIVLMGDFYQLPAIGGSLYAAALDPANRAGQLFRPFSELHNLITLTEQRRAADDPQHAARLHEFVRDPAVAPVTCQLLECFPVRALALSRGSPL